MLKKVLKLIVLLLFVLNNLSAQNTIDTTFNPFNEAIKYTPPRDSGIEFGISVLNIGMSTFWGDMSDHITPGISLNPSINIYYRRVYIFFDLFSTNLGKTRTNLFEPDINKKSEYEAWSSMTSIGYSMSGSGSFNFTPYIGPSWSRLGIYNDNDSIIKKFHSNGLIFGLKVILKTDPNKREPLLFKLLQYEGFQELFLNITFQPLNFNEKLKGTYFCFHLGFYFNSRIIGKNHLKL